MRARCGLAEFEWSHLSTIEYVGNTVNVHLRKSGYLENDTVVHIGEKKDYCILEDMVKCLHRLTALAKLFMMVNNANVN